MVKIFSLVFETLLLEMVYAILIEAKSCETFLVISSLKEEISLLGFKYIVIYLEEQVQP
jgi:hypothetical protein